MKAVVPLRFSFQYRSIITIIPSLVPDIQLFGNSYELLPLSSKKSQSIRTFHLLNMALNSSNIAAPSGGSMQHHPIPKEPPSLL